MRLGHGMCHVGDLIQVWANPHDFARNIGVENNRSKTREKIIMHWEY